MELNRVTNGWQRQAVNILAARPSQGKTALALILALNSDKPVLFFSLEMGKHELTNRLLSSISLVPLEDIQRGNMSQTQMLAVHIARNYLKGRRILIDDKAGLSTVNFLSRCRRWKRKYNIELVVVDYLQLMQVPDTRSKNREVIVSEISRTLKLGAKETDTSIIALSQMNREVEKGGKRKPQLSDLRESGAIEQDADIVMFIWHEEDANDGRLKNKVVFAKNRNGKVEDVELKFVGATQKWSDANDLSGEQFNPYAGIKPNYSPFEEEPF
jgi:replicative DNA helicase